MDEKAKQIIEKIPYITIATSDESGQPWNSPVYCAYDGKYNFYWASDQNGQHSKNISHNNKIFLVIYDSTVPAGTGEGVYIQAKAQMLTDVTEIKKALKLLYDRTNEMPSDKEEEAFLGEYPRRIYKAIPEKIWMNGDGEVNGNFIDIRKEVHIL